MEPSGPQLALRWCFEGAAGHGPGKERDSFGFLCAVTQENVGETCYLVRDCVSRHEGVGDVDIHMVVEHGNEMQQPMSPSQRLSEHYVSHQALQHLTEGKVLANMDCGQICL